MINSVLHHLGIGVNDPKAAESFFDRILVDFLSMEKEVTTEAVAGWKGRGTRLYLYPLTAGQSPGSLQHIAFSARTKAEVDRFVDWARENDVAIVSGPRSFPEYERDYYAVFFEGPENLRFELVHLTELDGSEPL